MVTHIVLPAGFGYVLAALISAVWVIVWQIIVVNGHRERAGIKHPQHYAEKAEVSVSREAYKFNCAQRAHQGTLEQMPSIIVITLISALRHPNLAAIACGAWTVSRVLYTIGYTSEAPEKRNTYGGLLGLLSFLTLLLSSTYTASQLVK
ncbi:hypothetical protein EDD17DRAFT_1702414 [Pisolithus thermaeus]|nr:hypothetical protein EDD17DRAFT_1702414 [Pisolithus thermaeus]